MTEEKFEKTLKDAKWVTVIYLIIYIVSICTYLGSEISLSGFSLFIIVLIITMLLISIYGFFKRKKFGPLLGIIVVSTSLLFNLLTLSINLIDLFISIAYLFECIHVLRYMTQYTPLHSSNNNTNNDIDSFNFDQFNK